MKERITSYTFDASAKTITFAENLSISALLLIVNVKTGDIIYNFADPLKGGTIAGMVLTLEHNTTSMSDTDDLMIYYDNQNSPSNTELQQSMIDTLMKLNNVLNLLANPAYVDKAANQIRSQVTGSVTATVSTTSLVNIDSIQGKILMNGSAQAAWATLVRPLIT